MKKKNLKKAVLALALAPCLILAGTGCGKDDDKKDTGLSTEQQNAAYTTLRANLAGSKFFNTGRTSNAVNLTYTNKFVNEGNFSQSGIPEAQWEAIAEEMDVPVGKSEHESKSEYEYGYKDDNTGYSIEKRDAQDKNAQNEPLQTSSFKTTDAEFVKKSGNDYHKYEYDYNTHSADFKGIYKVDDKYAVNTYKAEALEEINEELEGLMEYVTSNATLDEFKQDMAAFGNDMINSSMDGAMELPDDATTSIDFTLTDGVYSLVATIKADDLSMGEVPGFGDIKMDIDAKMTVKFDNDSIEGVDSIATMSANVDVNCKDTFGTTIPGITFDDDDHISVSMETTMGSSLNPNKAFDETVLTQDTTGYAGTGEEGAIEANSISIDYVYVDFDNRTGGGDSGVYNEVLGLTKSSCYEFDDEAITKTYYWDEACTQAVAADAVAPSYDTKLYVKLAVADGYAAILEKKVNEEGEISYGISHVHEIASGEYEYISLYAGETVTNVYVNGQEVANATEGLTFDQKGLYYVEVHVTEA